MEGNNWTQIEPRKRRIIELETRKTRGRPKFTDKRAIDQLSLPGLFSQAETIDSSQQATQEGSPPPLLSQITIDE